MATPKIKQDPIKQEDIAQFLASDNGFTFELQVLQDLQQSHRLICEHGGTYEDPVTKVKRQFDLRTRIQRGNGYQIKLAIECKHLKPNFPLVVQTMPSQRTQRYHEVLDVRETVSSYRMAETRSPYGRGQSIGKSLFQLGVKLDGSQTANDAQVYEKWAQAVSSADELVERSIDQLREGRGQVAVAIVPVLVVTDGQLWEASYDESGVLNGAAEQTDRVSFFLGVDMAGAKRIGGFRISHLEIVTQSGLSKFLNFYCKCPHDDDSFFDFSV